MEEKDTAVNEKIPNEPTTDLDVVHNVDKEISDENDNESEGITFKLDDFEGPLDLLLHLIKKNKMEIEDVKLADITDQYLEMMSDIDNIDMEKASEFIVMAAELIEIKSRSLLPYTREPEEEEEDPEYLKEVRIKEYLMLKEECDKLKTLECTDRFYKSPEPDANKYRIVLKDMQLDMLLDAFIRIMNKTEKAVDKPPEKEIEKEKFTVENKIASIKDALIVKKKIMFSELFSASISKNEIVTTFMALLELLKLQEIRVVQNDLFKDIEIEKREDDENSEDELGENNG